MSNEIRALIFDFDGLILDTEVPVYEAWRENYAAHGHELVLEKYVGCVGSDFGRFDPKLHLENLNGDPIDWDHWDEKREARALEMVNSLTEPMAGVAELLREARGQGISCAVASSSPHSWVDRHLERLKLTGFFKLTRCLDDVSAPKPSPELFLAAADGLGVAPEASLVFEDSLNGLIAATAAGMRCVAVPNLITEQLDFTDAALILPSLAETNLEGLFEAVRG